MGRWVVRYRDPLGATAERQVTAHAMRTTETAVDFLTWDTRGATVIFSVPADQFVEAIDDRQHP